MQQLKIDPEFRDKIPPLTEEEFQQLRENILADGEIREPIAVWNGVIVDGHNRWKIYLEHPELPEPKIKEMGFPDKNAAFEWMYTNQLGRRNLTEMQRMELIGKVYSLRKLGRSGNAPKERNPDGTFHGSKILSHGRKRVRTADIVGQEFGLSSASVHNAEKFSKGIDAIRMESPEAAEKILQGKTRASKESVIQFPKLDTKGQKKMIAAVVEGRAVTPAKKKEPDQTQAKKPVELQAEKPASHYNGGGTADYRRDREEIAAIVADMYDPSTVPEYTVDDMIDEIKTNGEEYVSIVRHVLSDRTEILTDKNRPIIVGAIEKVIESLRKVAKLLAISKGT